MSGSWVAAFGEAGPTGVAALDAEAISRLPGYSPAYNADEAIWDWISEDVTANTCLGTKAQVREHAGTFLHGLRARAEDVKRRCRTVLQAQADGLAMTTTELFQEPQDVDLTLA